MTIEKGTKDDFVGFLGDSLKNHEKSPKIMKNIETNLAYLGYKVVQTAAHDGCEKNRDDARDKAQHQYGK